MVVAAMAIVGGSWQFEQQAELQRVQQRGRQDLYRRQCQVQGSGHPLTTTANAANAATLTKVDLDQQQAHDRAQGGLPGPSALESARDAFAGDITAQDHPVARRPPAAAKAGNQAEYVR